MNVLLLHLFTFKQWLADPNRELLESVFRNGQNTILYFKKDD